MSADTVSNPIPLTSESNTARKKREKAEALARESAGRSDTPATQASDDAVPAANGESSNDSAYIKDIQKNIRNVNKKLNAMSKVASILAENPNVSLDELLASRKINADQKAQALKKPALQSSLTQLEEQLAQYKKIDSEYQTRLSTERETLTSSHKAEIEQLKEEARKEAESEGKATLRKQLLLFSQFLRAAAAKRVIEEEADSEESKAFEGALLLVYGGDEKAVDAAINIIEGSDQAVPSVEGQPLSVKYSEIKEASLKHDPYPAEEGWTENVADSAASTQPAATSEATGEDFLSDPTIAHAGLTELGAAQAGAPDAEDDSGIKSAVQGSTADDMANKAGANAGTEDGSLEESYEIVPRDPAETENPHEPALMNQTSSWADDAAAEQAASAPVATPQAPAAAAAPAPADDGFHEVERRNRGGRGGFRGDGEGRGRGRGRGGYRGERGGERGRGGHRGERRGGGEGRGGEGRGRGRGGPPRV